MGILFKKSSTKKCSYLPAHIGIIMDGNGRWAKKRGLPRAFGHRNGAYTFRNIAKYCNKIGLKHLTVYAFSTENWRRPCDEVNALINLFEEYLKEAVSDLQSENIKVKFLGEINRFSEKIRDLALKVENSSKNNDGMALNIAINYGGRKEIVNATKMIAKNILEKKIQISEIDESLFSNFLYTSGQPDVDLIIRTGGEFRISNFLIWQSAYAEYISTDILWPDFKTNNLDDALNIYAKRNRRFGGV